MARLVLWMVLCGAASVQVGCNAHAFGGRAEIYLLNDPPLDGHGQEVSYDARLSWDFVRMIERYAWTSDELRVDCLQAVAELEAAEHSVVDDPILDPKLVRSIERRTIVCVDPLVAVCVEEDRVVTRDSELSSSSVAFVRFGIGRLTLPLGYEAGTKIESIGRAAWLVVEEGQVLRLDAVDVSGHTQPLELSRLVLELRPTGDDTYKVVGEPVRAESTIVP